MTGNYELSQFGENSLRKPVSRRHFLNTIGIGVAAAAFGLIGAGIPAPRGLVGEYGFLSPAVLGFQTAAEIRSRIVTMSQRFGIRDFQFYDWFTDYSTPVNGNNWTDPYFHQIPISRRTIQISIDEIHRQGGRAWAYVQAVGAEEQGLEDPGQDIWKLRGKDGHWYWHPPGVNKPRFPTYFANAAWAKHMAQRWAPSVKSLGFDGIHWDTLGPIAGDYTAETAGIHAFIKTTQPLLVKLGLRQTMNMVDMAWWNSGIVRGYLEFPYVEVWSNNTADRYYAEMDKPDFNTIRGVMAMYPTTDVAHGQTAMDVIRSRHKAAAKHRLSYLIIGDGARRMKTEYWPDTVPLSAEEISLLQKQQG